MSKVIFEKEYTDEELVDLEDDIYSLFDPRDMDYNPVCGSIPVDDNGFREGIFKVTIEWIA